jgi:hypothetical protein
MNDLILYKNSVIWNYNKWHVDSHVKFCNWLDNNISGKYSILFGGYMSYMTENTLGTDDYIMLHNTLLIFFELPDDALLFKLTYHNNHI